MSTSKHALRARGLVIRNATVAIPQRTGSPFARVLRNCEIGVKDGAICSLKSSDPGHARQQPETETAAVCEDSDRSPLEIDARGGLVLPGLVLLHGHFYGAFARGLALKDSPATNFDQVLERLWWKLDRALTPDAVKSSAEVSVAAAIRSGTTTIFDHHSSPCCVRGSLDTIASVTSGAGVRANLAYEVSDRNGADGARAAIEENVAFLQRCRDAPSPLLSGTFGLHASFTLSDETLAACVAAKDDLGVKNGFHIHVAEGASDGMECQRVHAKDLVQRLADAAILSKKHDVLPTLIGHAVHLDQDELRELSHYNVAVAHNPSSNMNNGVGCAPVELQRSCALTVGLGTDGMTYSVLEEARIAYLLQKHEQRDPSAMPGDAVAQMIFQQNAGIAEEYFGLPGLGQLAVGAPADLAILGGYVAPTPISEGNLPWHLIFGARSHHVTDTICDGIPLMLDRELLEHTGLQAAEDRARESIVPEVWRSTELDATTF